MRGDTIMRINILTMIIVLTTMPITSKATDTRENIIAAATTEANTQYVSAPADTDELVTNVNHPLYYGTKSPLFLALKNANLWVNEAVQGCWYGAPYCYGNGIWKTDCQTRISQGWGIGASKDHYDDNEGTDDWAAGIDCSFFVCKCYITGYKTTSTLAEDGKAITKSQMQPADLFLWSGHHVILFGYWTDTQYSSAWVTHADGASAWERVHSEIWPYDSDYAPYAHPDFKDEYNTITYLINFAPYVLANGISVDFTTRYEENVRHYLLQRYSIYSDALIPVAKILAKGSGAVYSYLDAEGTKDHYYRLVEVEESGVQNILEYSHVFESKPEWDIDISTRDLRDINSIRIETSSILQKYRELATLPAMAMIQNCEWVAIYPDSFENDVDDLLEWRMYVVKHFETESSES